MEKTIDQEEQNKEIQKYFQDNKYVVIKGFLDPNMAGLLYQYAITTVRRTDFMYSQAAQDYRPLWDGQFGDDQAPISYNRYADPMMDTLLVASTKQLEKYTGMELTPQYSYWRLYQQTEVLKRHIDRESCEISTTLCLGYDVSNVDKEEHPNYNWPMYVSEEPNGEGSAAHLDPGDMIIYKGCEIEHWRDKFIGNHHAQVFLHYNDKNGPYNNVLDGRPLPGVPKLYQTQ